MQDKSNPIVQLESKYLVAFLLSFAWLLVGPVLFIIPLMMQSQIENGQIIMDGSGTFVLSNVANLIALAIIVGIFYPHKKLYHKYFPASAARQSSSN